MPNTQSRRLTDSDVHRITACLPIDLSLTETRELKTLLERAWDRSREVHVPSRGNQTKIIKKLIKNLTEFQETASEHAGKAGFSCDCHVWLQNELLKSLGERLDMNEQFADVERLQFTAGKVPVGIRYLQTTLDRMTQLKSLLESSLQRIESMQKAANIQKRRQDTWFVSALVKIWNGFVGEAPIVRRKDSISREAVGPFVDFAKCAGHALGKAPADHLIIEVVNDDLGVLDDDLYGELLKHARSMNPLSDN